MATSIIPATTSSVTATTNTNVANTTSTTAVDRNTLAENFTAFLKLLTTQLKNQNPLDPLDTNQFTQQLVQFAQVEQQLKSNDQLAKLVALEQAAQSTYALAFVGQSVTVEGTSAPLKDGEAKWFLSVPKPVEATVNIIAPNGQTVYSGTYNMNPGQQPFIWDGRDQSGQQWPDGNYKIAISAVDANRQPVSIPTEIEAIVDSADLTKNPPILSIAGQDYTLDKVKRVVRR
jgi:flagellar basal-body rod modification protein FlgD